MVLSILSSCYLMPLSHIPTQTRSQSLQLQLGGVLLMLVWSGDPHQYNTDQSPAAQVAGSKFKFGDMQHTLYGVPQCQCETVAHHTQLHVSKLEFECGSSAPILPFHTVIQELG